MSSWHLKKISFKILYSVAASVNGASYIPRKYSCISKSSLTTTQTDNCSRLDMSSVSFAIIENMRFPIFSTILLGMLSAKSYNNSLIISCDNHLCFFLDNHLLSSGESSERNSKRLLKLKSLSLWPRRSSP